MNILLSRQDIDINSISLVDFSNAYMKKMYKKTALHIAIENKDTKMTDILLSHSAIDSNILMINKLREISYFIDNICRHKLEENPDLASILPRDIHEKNEAKSPLFMAIELKNNKLIDHFINRKDIIIELNNAIYEEAIYYCYRDRVGVKYQNTRKNISNGDYYESYLPHHDN